MDNDTMSQQTQRQLPDEQNSIPDNAQGDLQTMERAMNLADQYETIKDRTVDDDTVLGRITDINTSRNNDRIIITIDVPGDDSNKEFRFRKPKVWSERYDFIRWIRHYGYDADSFPNMLRDDCKVKVLQDENREYNLYIPPKSGFRLDGVKQTAIDLKELYLSYRIRVWPVLLIALSIRSIAVATGLVGFSGGVVEQVGMTFIGFIIIALIAIVEEDEIYD